ncbi:hypothetical protein TL16_g10340, partial [Triparma laevis f. inornata]|uniref:Uncharacterized protein n=2 Tax=Triparma laevis TaxID=1534972 RepID=A0A9W7C7K8_9STRA
MLGLLWAVRPPPKSESDLKISVSDSSVPSAIRTTSESDNTIQSNVENDGDDSGGEGSLEEGRKSDSGSGGSGSGSGSGSSEGERFGLGRWGEVGEGELERFGSP